jgi:4,5-dihydroxyphthalate decarboxylase
LIDGEIDALLTAQVPAPFVKRAPQVRRLFADPRAVETDHFRRTGIFPIMHVMVLREELLQRHPWVAQSLYKALLEAKQHCVEMIFRNDAIHSVIPWAANHAEEVRQLMGQDFWPYGIEANRKTLETFLRYSIEQGVASRSLGVDELFPRATLETFKV